MELKTVGRNFVEEAPYGTYVYRCTDGEYLGDGEGRLMCVFGMKGDRKKVARVIEAARHYGFKDGTVEFWPGQRPVSDEEYEEQVARAKLGLTPDPLDYGMAVDNARNKRKYG